MKGYTRWQKAKRSPPVLPPARLRINTEEVTKANSLQNLNVRFITDESLYAIANDCPQIKTIVIWNCRHVTENGLNKLVDKCRKLESINVWAMKVPMDCFFEIACHQPYFGVKTSHSASGCWKDLASIINKIDWLLYLNKCVYQLLN